MSVFLSYRRADNSHALSLYTPMIRWFGRDQVFWDRKDIDPGSDFESVIKDQIQASQALIAIVSDNWLSAVDEQGVRRIDSADDWIHLETRLAFEYGLRVIPVLAGGMKPPTAGDLPDELKQFAKLQMLSMTDMDFHNVLRENLEQAVTSQTAPIHPYTEGTVRFHRRAGGLLRRQIQRLQVRAAELIDDGKLDRATEELDEGVELVMVTLELLPGDATLDAHLGYLFGTASQAFERAGDLEQASQYRDLATSVFQRLGADPKVPEDNPLDRASALNGIGGVHLSDGDAATAIEYYRAALEIDPRYCYAWHDRFLAYDQLAKRGSINLSGMRRAIDMAHETGAGQPGLGADKFDRMEFMFGEWKNRVAEYPYMEITDGSMRLVPQALTLVITESRPRDALFNFNCGLVHQIAKSVTLRNMEIELCAPDGRKMEFHWNVFYGFQASARPEVPMMSKLCDAKAIEIEVGLNSLGVQFKGPTTDPSQLWVPGLHEFTWRATVDANERNDSFEIETRLAVDIGYESEHVKRWCQAPREDWDQLNDPDRAVGIPVRIVPTRAADVAHS